ncbi:helix-turn-helix domain-containing protein [Terribacillus sp. DMT04]|uniref:helix-turn-helix domain-containing protein n=1 Tax=Terribacillus sp. DMT04 TaxID=2850441 RepID=UPI001C2BBA10|nr:helix-turn-helix domain-containing protein [Terribacillus sp. DMT04]QXE01244.1 transposase [Terribacillus sp. DMT04]
MVKYSEGFKLKVVKEYLNGNRGYASLAKKYGIGSKTQVIRWVALYEKFGEDSLLRKRNYEAYSVQFKLDVLDFMKRTGASTVETALSYRIMNPSVISQWKITYEKEGIDALERPRGRPSMSNKPKKKNKKMDKKMMSREEELERENELLRLEVEYLKKLRAFQMNPESYLEKHKQRYHSNSKKRSD